MQGRRPVENAARNEIPAEVPWKLFKSQASEPPRLASRGGRTKPVGIQRHVENSIEEDRFSLSRQTTGTSYLSALSPTKISSRRTTKGHRRTQSESNDSAFNNKELDDTLVLRKTRSAVSPYRTSQDSEQEVGQKSNRVSRQLQRSDWIRQRGSSPPFDSTRLDHQLLRALRKDPSTGHRFLPSGVLKELVTQKSVSEELSKLQYIPIRIKYRTWKSSTYVRIGTPEDHKSHHPTETHFYQESTHQPVSYQKIFAVLLFIDRPNLIWAFVKSKISDVDLPFAKVRRMDNGLYELRRYTDVQKSIKCLKKERDIDRFVSCQWRVLAPVFGEPDGELFLHGLAWKDHIIMPFLSWEGGSRRGGSGVVDRVEVHPSHYNIGPIGASILPSLVPSRFVAVKRLLSDDREDYEHESNVLRNLRRKRHTHPHMITLLATYERRGDPYLVFPWAEMDLAHYWKSKSAPPHGDAALSRWMKEQCSGLAGAIANIHRYNTYSGTTMLNERSQNKQYSHSRRPSRASLDQGEPTKTLIGRHGDIKPENILWFPDLSGELGILKISDFGTAHFSLDGDISEEHKKRMPNSIAYQSPESQIPDAKISCQCDVWALGCVFLEFVCWYFEGYRGLEEFEKARAKVDGTSSFFAIKKEDRSSAELKMPVNKVILELQGKCDSHSDTLKILDAVEKGMLQVLNDNTTSLETGNDDDSGSSGLLRVASPPYHRRKSVGNIARQLGAIS